jgi:hypothetical protein
LYKSTDVSEEYTASIFMNDEYAKRDNTKKLEAASKRKRERASACHLLLGSFLLALRPQRLTQYVPLKRREKSAGLHDLTPKTLVVLVVTAVKISNAT